jgi:hypothetical protein
VHYVALYGPVRLWYGVRMWWYWYRLLRGSTARVHPFRMSQRDNVSRAMLGMISATL